MHLFVFFFLIFIRFTDALNCIDGFTQLNNKCVWLISINSAKDDARRKCNLFGGSIVSIRNSIDNTAIAKFAFTNSDPIWIGLKCSTDLTPSSCIWEDQLGNASSYSNFISGNPSIANGQCVYMLTTGALTGKWLSGDCDTARSAVCETDPIGQCSHPFGGYCYYPMGELTIVEAQSACAQNCDGNLVSIHSSSENDYIASLFKDPTITYVRIGAQLSSSAVNSWIDGTSWDYSNIGYQNYGVGSCYSLSLKNGVVSAGKWISSDCSSPQPPVCKWVPSSSCTSPTPAQCNPTYLTDTGKIYSPNYPNAYTTTYTSPCYYILTTSSNSRPAALWFDDFDLDSGSSLELYSSIDGKAPFLILDQSKQGSLNNTIISSTNVMMIIFKPCTQNCDKSRNYKWSAGFGQYYGGLYDTNQLFTNGVFSSSNYPNSYSGDWSTYLLQSLNGKRIQLHFDTFDTLLNADYVKIHDGSNTGSPVIATLSGDLRGSNWTFTASSYFLTLTFNPTSSNGHTGFLARYYDLP